MMVYVHAVFMYNVQCIYIYIFSMSACYMFGHMFNIY